MQLRNSKAKKRQDIHVALHTIFVALLDKKKLTAKLLQHVP
jgi:hypothetical protein